MTDTMPTRRSGGRDARRAARLHAHLERTPYLTRKLAPFEVLGEEGLATIEENAVVKQWFGFSSFEEAERISRAMGEARYLQHSLGYTSGRLDLSGNLSTTKDRLFTAEQLMRLPVDEQILHVKDVGFVHCRKLGQNQIAPFCHGGLAPNPLEGGQLPADPKVRLNIRRARR